MWFIEARPGVIAWRSRGSTGGTLPGAGTGQRIGWGGVVSGKPQVFAWPKANGSGGAVAQSGRPMQWRGVNRRMSVFAWRAPNIIGANPPPPPPPPPPPSPAPSNSLGGPRKGRRISPLVIEQMDVEELTAVISALFASRFFDG